MSGSECKFDKHQIQNINYYSSEIRKTIYLSIAYLCFYLITTSSTIDADFYFGGALTNLPLINIEISTTNFFYIASLIATALHVRLLIYFSNLRNFYKETSKIYNKNIFDHIEFSEALYLIDWFQHKKPNKINTYRSEIIFISITAILWLTPAALFYTWFKSFSSHDPLLTIFLSLLISISIHTSLREYVGLKKWDQGVLKSIFNEFRETEILKNKFDCNNKILTLTPGAIALLISVTFIIIKNNLTIWQVIVSSILIFVSVYLSISILFNIILRNVASAIVFLGVLTILSLFSIQKTTGSIQLFTQYYLPLTQHTLWDKRFNNATTKDYNKKREKYLEHVKNYDFKSLSNIEPLFFHSYQVPGNSIIIDNFKKDFYLAIQEHCDQKEAFNQHNEIHIEKIWSNCIATINKEIFDHSNSKEFYNGHLKKLHNDLSLSIDSIRNEKYLKFPLKNLEFKHMEKYEINAGIFINSRFYGSWISGSKIKYSNFEGVSMTRTYALNSLIESSIFINSSLRNSDFSYSLIKNSNFLFSKLESTKLNNSILTDIDFGFSNMEKTDFKHSIIYNSNFLGAINLTRESFSEAIIVSENKKISDDNNFPKWLFKNKEEDITTIEHKTSQCHPSEEPNKEQESIYFHFLPSFIKKETYATVDHQHYHLPLKLPEIVYEKYRKIIDCTETKKEGNLGL